VDQHLLLDLAVRPVDRDGDGIIVGIAAPVPQGPVNRRIEESVRKPEQLSPSQARHDEGDCLDGWGNIRSQKGDTVPSPRPRLLAGR